MARSTFVYVSYIRTTPEQLWAALTTPDFMRQYWFGCHCESTYTAGASWTLVGTAGNTLDDGEIVEADPPRRMVIRWRHRHFPEVAKEGPSLCTMEIEPTDTAVKLTIIHESDNEASQLIEKVSGGWPKIVSNLKSLLETGSIALGEAYPKAAA